MNNRKKMYRVYSTWQMDGHHDVEAWSQEGAEEQAADLPLPSNGEYVDGSYETLDSKEIEQPAKIKLREVDLSEEIKKSASVQNSN